MQPTVFFLPQGQCGCFLNFVNTCPIASCHTLRTLKMKKLIWFHWEIICLQNYHRFYLCANFLEFFLNKHCDVTMKKNGLARSSPYLEVRYFSTIKIRKKVFLVKSNLILSRVFFSLDFKTDVTSILQKVCQSLTSNTNSMLIHKCAREGNNWLKYTFI